MSAMDHDHFQIPYPLPAGQMAIVVGDKCVLLEYDALPDLQRFYDDEDGTDPLSLIEFSKFSERYLLPAIANLKDGS